MPLLPNEPCMVDEATQKKLTEQFLMPALDELGAFFVSLRQSLDHELSQALPVKQGKPYPLGQCLEISLALFKRLPHIDPAFLAPQAANGLRALIRFVRQGGSVRQVWGDLRGEYFQNAFQVGGLYVDVANDTVNPDKPPVEILPFAEAHFLPIGDFEHFSRVAARYWQAHIYPNHLIPALAPYAPLVSVTASGWIQLQSASDYMVALTQAGGFRPSEVMLQNADMNASLFALLHKRLSTLPIALAGEPDAGQASALAWCKTYRERGANNVQQRNQAMRAVVQVNAELARFTVDIKGSTADAYR